MATVMLFLQQTTGKTERHTHFCMPLEPVFTRDCGGRVHFTDEPTGALDSRASDELLQLFTEVNRSGQTILMVTHSTAAASRANRVLFIKDGEVFHQIYRMEDSDETLYQKISDTLTILMTGGEQR
jgi:ABC-type antimicrobial peptide transport system, ATPase component